LISGEGESRLGGFYAAGGQQRRVQLARLPKLRLKAVATTEASRLTSNLTSPRAIPGAALAGVVDVLGLTMNSRRRVPCGAAASAAARALVVLEES
jgi:hypothetical protein